MNIRESGARSARQVTAVLGVAGATLASVIGVTVWAGTSAAGSTSSTNVQSGDGHGFGDDDGSGASNGFGASNGSVGPGQGGGSHGTSNGS